MPPTPKGPSATKIFISYSRKDRAWLERLKVHLKPLESFGIERWDDTRLETGELWREQIERAIASAKVAILLVSADFLASNFIENEELPPLLAKAEQKGTMILQVILTACLFSETKSLSRYMTINPPSEPLDKLNEAERNEVWVRLARTILDHLSESKKPEAEAPPEDLFSDVEVKDVPQATPPPEVPAPIPAAGPEGGRYALLVVNDKYDSPAFAKLVAQSDDSRSLESVLTSHNIGGFNVTTLRNESHSKVTQEVKAFFSNRRPEDVLLLYYCGIGLKDDSCGLLFTSTDTDPDDPATSVPAYILQGAMRKCQSRGQVVLLDCCYVGSYSPGASAEACERPGLTAGFQGEGRYVLSLGDRLCFAREKGTDAKPPIAETNAKMGDLITHMVHGLKSSKADLDGNRKISVEELFQYVEESVASGAPDIRPSRWAFDQSRSATLIIADAALPGEDKDPTAIQKRYNVVQDIRLPILDLIAPTYLLDKHFYFLDWNPAFDELIARPLKLVRGLHHAKAFVQACDNCEDVVKHAKETFGVEREPLTDTEIMVFNSDREGQKKYGLIQFQKVACQISDERGESKGWSVNLNILQAVRGASLWADLMARIEESVSWSRYAAVYDTLLLEFPEYLDLVKLVTSQVGNARRCLDLGAGTGNGTIRLLEDNPNREVWAVEINDTMLRNFRAKLEASGFNEPEKLTIVKDNILRLDALPSRSFDAAVMINVLYAVADHAQECLRSVNRVLKKGGILSLSTPHRQTDVNRLFNRLEEVLESKGLFEPYQEHFDAARARHDAMDDLIHRHTIDDLSTLLVDAGFQVEEMIPDQYVGTVVVIKAVKVKEPDILPVSEAAPTSVQDSAAAPDQATPAALPPRTPVPGPRALHDVFISYAEQDQAIALAILDHLESLRIKCWIAPRDIKAGMNWPASIVQAIDHSRVFLIVLTGNANRSGNALREVARAADKNIPVIPFRIEPIPPSDDLAYYLSNVHWLDAFPPPLQTHLPRLVETLTAVLSRMAGAAAEAEND